MINEYAHISKSAFVTDVSYNMYTFQYINYINYNYYTIIYEACSFKTVITNF